MSRSYGLPEALITFCKSQAAGPGGFLLLMRPGRVNLRKLTAVRSLRKVFLNEHKNNACICCM